MPVTLDIVDAAGEAPFEAVFGLLEAIDRRFSPFKAESELCRLDRGDLAEPALSGEMREVLALAEDTGRRSNGYFRIRRPDGGLDPSGVVKGWAIKRAADLLRARGHRHFCVEVAGDMEVSGLGPDRQPWRVGLRNPFDAGQIVKVLALSDRGIATSGTATQGQHIYDPHRPGHAITRIVSLTVIGPDVLEADRFATAAFAMEEDGIDFIEETPGLEGYAIGADRVATLTSGFRAYVTQ
ncbi:FAD:protein FMN transferase [Acidimangrovimonas sediminis]|uniref:FAD:protein FMN transferase n=1 Tax=Acidimangrovimonas sediminis TaxID=2056283 RepID=UPI0018EB5EFD|nr:FAD:protein FMN transferase [Acidimangrovimonas sediminis]